MEGCTTAVSAALVLPAQPAAGSLVYVPLGGDGQRAPKFAWALRVFQLSGDASGGAAQLTVTLDPRYTSLVSLVTWQIAQGAAADADFRVLLRGDTSPTVLDLGTQDSTVSLVSAFEVGRTWNPTPIVLPGGNENAQIQAHFKNVDGDEYFLDALIYAFDIDVRQRTPMGPLLWSRGAT